ncbi:hypothetical protein ACP8Y2_21790 [Herpetosiphon llansteffanensis]
MKYFYLLVVCLLLVSCETATSQVTEQLATPQVTATWSPIEQIPVGVASTNQAANDLINQSLQHRTIRNLVIQEVIGLEGVQMFVYSFNGDVGFGLGLLIRTIDDDGQQVSSPTLAHTQWPRLTDPPISQFQLPERKGYLLYGYMPTNFDQTGKIFLKNGQVLWFNAGSGLQSRLLPLDNPALNVQMLDAAEQVISDRNLFYE